MKSLITEFLSLRPIWTRRGIEAAWYIYLAGAVIQLGYFANFLHYVTADTAGVSYLSLIQSAYSILFTVAHLALVRMFLEMALNFLVKSRDQ